MKNYQTDPKEIYTLELNKLQRCFSQIQQVGENVSDLPKIGWRQVEHIKQMNFILMEALQVGKIIIDRR